MSVKADKIKSGYTELTPDERNEVKEFIRKYDDASYFEKGNLSESISRAANKSTGPKDSSSCPCCGR